MALYKIKDFYPDYRDLFGDHDILGYDLYSGDEKVGSVDNLLVDEDGKFRYLVIGTGVWIFGKKVLLPIGRARMDYNNRRVYADTLTREQVESLPEFKEDDAIEYDQEERVRDVYRPSATSTMASGMTSGAVMPPGDVPVDAGTTVGSSAPLTGGTVDRPLGTTPTYDRDNYQYDYDPDLYNLNEQNHQHLRLYEERLIANKTRMRTGEVRVGKHVETENAHVSVPVERERVVIERHAPTDARATTTPGADAFNEGERQTSVRKRLCGKKWT
jgi:stress response protein YsnF